MDRPEDDRPPESEAKPGEILPLEAVDVSSDPETPNTLNLDPLAVNEEALVDAKVPSSLVPEQIPDSVRSAMGSQVSINEMDDPPVPPSIAGSDRSPKLWTTEYADDTDAPESTANSEGSALDSVDAEKRPSYRFFGIVAALSLFADISTKVWAELVINQRGFEPISVIGNHVSITLAYNQGGAWGLFSSADEMIRKPFFLVVSGFAIFFIISLYSRLHPTQTALKWGLPLVLGGALGNLSDRITRSQVIDFIDYEANWVLQLNGFIKQYVSGWALTSHWPTFNIADVAIVVGVGLMAVDMFTHRAAPGNASNDSGPTDGESDAGADGRAVTPI